MRTLNEFYNDFVNAADFGSIRYSHETGSGNYDCYSAIVDIDGRSFLLSIDRTEILGLSLHICEDGEFVNFIQSDLSEGEEYMLEFIYNFLAA